MKRILPLILLTALLSACTPQTEPDIFCEVTLRARLADGRPVVSLHIGRDVGGNMFRNLNTGMDYPFPPLVNGTGSLRVLKGVYMIGFDATALLEDGREVRVRFVEWNSPIKAMNLLEDSVTLEMNLMLM